MSHPSGLPDLFLDRDLGRIEVPRLLREAGLRLVTLAEHYGIPADQNVRDVEWLELAGRRGWVAVTKDTKIRYRTPERNALIAFGVRCFCMLQGGKTNLTAQQNADRFLNNLETITSACSQKGPFIYVIYENGIRRVL